MRIGSGENTNEWVDGWARMEGWPNIPRELVEPGKFNSPHGMAAGADGNLYVVEWLIGGG